VRGFTIFEPGIERQQEGLQWTFSKAGPDGKWGFRVIFVILIYYAFLLLPLGLFLAAAVAEIRSYQEGPAFFLRMVEIVAGIIGVLAIPSKFWSTPVVSPGALPPFISSSTLLSLGGTIISPQALSWRWYALRFC
jgi:hypothetical protein